MGSLTIGSDVAVEGGTWGGSTIPSSDDTGQWEGEFRPTNNSGGSVPGTVEVESSPGTLITSFQTEVATELPLLPSGEDVAPVGGVTFAANVPVGATIKVKLTLPPGSHPTSLLKLVDGSYVVVPSTISGEVVEYEITDGGRFDEDDVANGEIIDPVVPVSSGLQIRTGELPQATPGTPYSEQLSATGGTGTLKWKRIGPKLPKGLKLTKTGSIEGTPTKKVAPGVLPGRSPGHRLRQAEAHGHGEFHPGRQLTTVVPSRAPGRRAVCAPPAGPRPPRQSRLSRRRGTA